MAKSKKTDNSNLQEKVALRKHFLEKFHMKHGRPIKVFDACQGNGHIWHWLRNRFDCQYWGVDLKPKKGRLKIDSVRVLEQPGLNYDVIDIDTYGSPWKHYLAMLPNIIGETTVFLTSGMVKFNGIGSVQNASLEAAGLKFEKLKVPTSIGTRIAPYLSRVMLGQAYRHGLQVAYCAHTPGTNTAKYTGIHLTRAE